MRLVHATFDSAGAMETPPWGVWATSDSEIIITPSVLLLHRRLPDRLEACLYGRENAHDHLHAVSASLWGRDWWAAVLDEHTEPPVMVALNGVGEVKRKTVQPCFSDAGAQGAPTGRDHLSYQSRDRQHRLLDGSEEEPAGGISQT